MSRSKGTESEEWVNKQEKGSATMKQQTLFSVISKGILVLALLALCGGLASAAEVGTQMERKVLKLGGATTIETSQSFTRVSLADPKIADYVVLSSREIYIHGKAVVTTRTIL